MDRARVMEALEELARLSELEGDNPFKVRAYQNGARALDGATTGPEGWEAPGALEAIPGVGKGIAQKVRELLRTGTMAELEAARERVPPGVREMLEIPGLGPKKVSALWREMGITGPGELEYACVENRLAALKGFGPKTQARVLEGLSFRKSVRGKILLPAARGFQEEVVAGTPPPAGAAWGWTGEGARSCEVVSGLELVTADRGFAEALAARHALAVSGDGFSGALPGGPALSVRVVAPAGFGAALVWDASAPAFREALAGRLAAAGLGWDAGGLRRGARRVATPDEGAFWDAAGTPAVPAECREWAEAVGLDATSLVAEPDLRGAFHVHTDWSDGGASLEAMVAAAEALGWSWVGICDHSASAAYAGGLDAGRLAEQGRAIAALQAGHPGIRVFKGVESDILGDGLLDYPREVLAGLEVVVASVHSRFSLREAEQTARLVRAASDPATTMLGHPTGRLLLAREGYAHDWEAVADAVAAASAVVELNANPHRLDVDWRRIPALRAAGVRVAVNPDAHAPAGLKDVWYGLRMARKGLCTRSDVVNALEAPQVAEWLNSLQRRARS